MVRHDQRGQVFTLEGFIAALLVLSSVFFVLNVTAVTPLSASASNQHVENQQSAMATGLLDVAAANESLKPTLLAWDDANGGFYDASADGYYLTCGFDTAFGVLLAQTFEANGVACNVNLRYVTASGNLSTERLVYVGEPTDTAVRATSFVTLYDDDRLVTANGTDTNVTLANASTFYAPDAAPNDPLYNVIEVEVIVWRL